MRTLEVNVPGAAYPIEIGAGILDERLRAMVQRWARDLVVVVTNDTLARLYPERIDRALAGGGWRVETCVVPDGERHKSLETVSAIYDRLMALEANRRTLVVAFGGGVVGDMAGFAAATYMRGVPLLQVPTTLLAQVDSSIGGKTAVNHPCGKNIVGAFKQPVGVVMELDFLRTLPPRELRSGLVELIKHGVIRDRDLFGFLETNRTQFAALDWAFWEEAVYRSCRVKAAVVAEDAEEEHLRALLNYGHTLAHLIETHTGYSSYLHGEAVAAGMLFAGYVSRDWGHLSDADFQRMRRLMAPVTTPVTLPPLDEAAFAALLMHDKKAAGRAVRFILLQGLGRAFIREDTTPAELWPLFNRFCRELPDVLRVAPE